jgi:methylated-DNA-[protein]-cysteine S-methyltransferase
MTAPDTALDRLRARLASDAAAAGLLDLAYSTVPTPVGTLLLVCSDAGLLRVAFDCEDHDRVLHTLADRVSHRILRAPDRLAPVATQMEEYFAGTLRAFDLPLDRRLSSGFRRTVLGHLEKIGYGTTESYAQVAVAAGSPRAVRAVGTACATNPLPVVVPCHRVVRSDGAPGQYVGGPRAKQALLALESAG